MKVRASKVIRDAVWDYHRFEPYEIHLLNCPFLQRLRGISQTSLASYTYPSATHNRFQHTLGTVMVLDRLTTAVANNDRGALADALAQTQTQCELRLAALLHDVGHGVFSHSSEDTYGTCDGLLEYAVAIDAKDAAPHELLGHMIVTSPEFGAFVKRVLVLYGVTHNIDLTRVADMIVGNTAAESQNKYLAEFINGVFDVDKLDYVTRDAHSSGLKLIIDIDRLAYTLLIREYGGDLHLAVDISGTPVVEQMIFNKILLTSSVYHHHKVRAANCMLRGLFDIAANDGCSYRFTSPTDFLRARESDCLCTRSAGPAYCRMANALGSRRLLKRALVIARGTIDDPPDVIDFKNLLKSMRTAENVELLRKRLFNDVAEAGLAEDYGPEYFWWDFPKPPSFREPSQCLVEKPDGVSLLEAMFNLDDWSKAYIDNNLKAHAFCPPDLDRRAIGDIARNIFQEVASVGLNEKAISLAKIG
jgi:hypothetical protein